MHKLFADYSAAKKHVSEAFGKDGNGGPNGQHNINVVLR